MWHPPVTDCEEKRIGVTNQRETTVVCSRKTGKPLARTIVWGDSRTRGIVIYFENLLESRGIEIDGKDRRSKDRRSKDGALEITQVRGSSRTLCHRARASVHTYPPPHVLALLTTTPKKRQDRKHMRKTRRR